MTPAHAWFYIKTRNLETHEKALNARVGLDIRKWGESEALASRALHQETSHALLLNSIAVYDVDNLDRDLMAAARALMTSTDKRQLRMGG